MSCAARSVYALILMHAYIQELMHTDKGIAECLKKEEQNSNTSYQHQ